MKLQGSIIHHNICILSTKSYLRLISLVNSMFDIIETLIIEIKIKATKVPNFLIYYQNDDSVEYFR